MNILEKIDKCLDEKETFPTNPTKFKKYMQEIVDDILDQVRRDKIPIEKITFDKDSIIVKISMQRLRATINSYLFNVPVMIPTLSGDTLTYKFDSEEMQEYMADNYLDYMDKF